MTPGGFWPPLLAQGFQELTATSVGEPAARDWLSLPSAPRGVAALPRGCWLRPGVLQPEVGQVGQAGQASHLLAAEGHLRHWEPLL